MENFSLDDRSTLFDHSSKRKILIVADEKSKLDLFPVDDSGVEDDGVWMVGLKEENRAGPRKDPDGVGGLGEDGRMRMIGCHFANLKYWMIKAK